ncbi:hypothetical protein [Vibrio sp. DNB22_12_1]
MSIVCFLQGYWKEIIATIVAMFSIWKYFDTRKKELSWKKTEFLFTQSHYIDTDSEMQLAIQIIDGEHSVKLTEIFDSKGYLTELGHEYLSGFHKLFNLLDRIAYSVLRTNALSMDEAAQFGWHFTSIARQKCLSEYCYKNGYKQVLEFSKEMEKFFKNQKS